MPQRNKKKTTNNRRKGQNKRRKSQKSPKKQNNNENVSDVANKNDEQLSTTDTTTPKPAKKETPKKPKKAMKNDQEEEEEKKEDKPRTLKDVIFDRPNKDKRNPNREHKFWNKQPVPQMGDTYNDDINGPIEEKTLDDVRKQPYLLPPQFEWVELDLNDDKEVDELYHLLANHYVEDDDNRFRFNYSRAFLRWALMVPGFLKQWHLGI